MRKPEEHCVVGCPTEEEMDKEMELYLIEQYKLGELALKIYRHGYHNGYDEGKAEGSKEFDEAFDKGYRDGYDDGFHANM